MAKEFFHYDPLTGINEYFDFDDDTGTAIIRKEQDVEPYLRYAAHVRNVGASDARLKEDDYLCLYAIIPPIVQIELIKKGLDLHSPDPSMERRVRKEIEQNYPWLKTTHKVDM